jgi:hypothetical protein
MREEVQPDELPLAMKSHRVMFFVQLLPLGKSMKKYRLQK